MTRGETLGQLITRKARECGELPAMECTGRITSFAELDDASDRVATALIRDGMAAQQRIAYLGKNSDRYFELLFGAAKGGLVIVPIGWRLSADEIRQLLTDSEARHLFVEPEFIPVARDASAGLNLTLVSTGEEAEGVPAYDQWLASRAGEKAVLPDVDPRWPVIQLYTSGTTGKPKGAMLTHDNMFPLRPMCAAANLKWDEWQAEDVSLLTMPVAHIAGTGWGLVAFYSGAKSIILREFDAGEIIRLISEENVSRIFLVPTALQAMMRHPDAASGDYSRLRYICYGASPIPLEILKQAIDMFGCGFVQNYGMTETTGTVVALPPEDHDPAGNARMKSAGMALPGVRIRIVDEAGQDLPPGAVGQVLISSPTTMAGYWHQPEATAATLVDGWMSTGDAGYLDEDGYLYICDRMKDMIISGGENVYPVEVEGVLHGHPLVTDVAVIGVPDSHWGEAVTAFIVPAGEGADADAIVSWARQKLASYKVPKQIHFCDELPRNANGKILKRVLREPFWADKDKAVH